MAGKKKYEEGLAAGVFPLPKPLKAELASAAKKNNKDMTEIVREAIKRELQRMALNPDSDQSNQNLPNPNSFTLSLPAHIKEGFEKLTEHLDYPGPEYMAQELIRSAVIHPEKARDILFSDADRIIQKAQQATREVAEKRGKKAA